MALNNVKDGKLLYHLTKLSNLDSILEHGLISRKQAEKNNIGFSDIADQVIISKRIVNDLDEYVPFHFHPHSAFDAAVRHRYNEEIFIYICFFREKAKKENFMILPKHPLSSKNFQLFRYEEGIKKIDWEAMQTLGNEDEYVKQVKMAECLTTKTIPVNCFNSIAVPTEEIKKMVSKKLRAHDIGTPMPFVDVRNWF